MFISWRGNSGIKFRKTFSCNDAAYILDYLIIIIYFRNPKSVSFSHFICLDEIFSVPLPYSKKSAC